MLIFLGESEARAGWASDLAKVNPPEIVNKSKLTAYFYEVITWSKNSKAAQSIISVVKNSTTPIYVIGMSGGGFSCFNSDYPEPGVGTVYYSLSLDMAVGFTTSGPHDTASKMNLDRDARHARLGAPMGTRRDGKAPESFHNYIGFLHELGHAKQFIENPLFFAGAYTNSKEFTAEIEAAGRDRKGFWSKAQSQEHRAKLHDLAPKQIRPRVSPQIASAAPAKPGKVAPPGSVAPPPPVVAAAAAGPGGPPGGPPGAPPMFKKRTPQELEAERLRKDPCYFQGHKAASIDGWSVRIETDNLIRHGWPICDEMGYPKRNYNDLIVRRESG